jgi:hypothetical protein
MLKLGSFRVQTLRFLFEDAATSMTGRIIVKSKAIPVTGRGGL